MTTTAGNQDHAVDAFALQMRPGVTKNLAAVIPKVTHFLKKALTAGQSFVMGLSRYDLPSSGSQGSNFPAFDVVDDKELQDAVEDAVGNILRLGISEELPKYTTAQTKKLAQGLARRAATILINDTDSSEAKIAAVVEEATSELRETLLLIEGEIDASLENISGFVPRSTISRHNKLLADLEEFQRQLESAIEFVELIHLSEVMMISTPPISPTGNRSMGAGLSAIKLAQARKQNAENALFRLFGTTYAEQSTSTSLVIPSDLATSFLGVPLLDDIIAFMRTQVLAYPLPYVYVKYMKDSYRSELGIVKPDFSALPERVRVTYDTQNKLLYEAIYQRLTQSLKDRVDNTHSFAQTSPSITVTGGVPRYDGVLLVWSLTFMHRECHSTLESRIRKHLYSYHLAMKSQPLLVVLEGVRRDLALAQQHGVKLSWSETGELWYDTVSQRSILMATELTAFGH